MGSSLSAPSAWQTVSAFLDGAAAALLAGRPRFLGAGFAAAAAHSAAVRPVSRSFSAAATAVVSAASSSASAATASSSASAATATCLADAASSILAASFAFLAGAASFSFLATCLRAGAIIFFNITLTSATSPPWSSSRSFISTGSPPGNSSTSCASSSAYLYLGGAGAGAGAGAAAAAAAAAGGTGSLSTGAAVSSELEDGSAEPPAAACEPAPPLLQPAPPHASSTAMSSSSSSPLPASPALPSASSFAASALALATSCCSVAMTPTISWLTCAFDRNSHRSVLQRGQGLRLRRTRSVRAVGAMMSLMPSNLSSRQPLQKLWPHGVDSGAVHTSLHTPHANSLSAFSWSDTFLRRRFWPVADDVPPPGRRLLDGAGFAQPQRPSASRYDHIGSSDILNTVPLACLISFAASDGMLRLSSSPVSALDHGAGALSHRTNR
mmetsp:Transcript_19853/g.58990  ORF Transcript_19853/g.58990 Transcript_19853/m.58990 type:complete len:440 (+) Transcript_19853:245-1564(+)